jgi:Tfp pilus assembly ATPase PilU
MNQALERLVKAGTVSPDEALRSSSSPDDLRLKLSGFTRDEGYEVAGFKPGSE